MNLVSSNFLAASEIIDWQRADIQSLARELALRHTDDLSIARSCFEWVRDNIQHSLDFARTELTCRASDVLLKRTGYCYAKSHLLAALLRANDIPAGFCYQRLTVSGDQRLHVNGGEKSWRLAGEKCSALPVEITRWSVAGSSLREVCSLLRPCTGPA